MKTLLTLLFSFSFSFLFGQLDTIYFANPSFEGVYEKNRHHLSFSYPKNLISCGFLGENLPKLRRVEKAPELLPADGNSFMALQTNENNSWQSITQSISKPLTKGKCYAFSAALATAKKFHTGQAFGEKVYQKNPQPVVLRIYGGNEQCGMEQVLGYTQLIGNTDWQDYFFSFEASDAFRFITFEVYYQVATVNHYEGNVLIDFLSPIIPISCGEANYIDQNTQDKFIATRKLRDRELSELENSQNQRSFATIDILIEKISMLSKEGLFMTDLKEINPDAKFLLNEIIELLKVNKNIGIDIGIKKTSNKSLRKWRREFLSETFDLNELGNEQYDVDKIGLFLDANWAVENDFIAIDVYKIR